MRSQSHGTAHSNSLCAKGEDKHSEWSSQPESTSPCMQGLSANKLFSVKSSSVWIAKIKYQQLFLQNLKRHSNVLESTS